MGTSNRELMKGTWVLFLGAMLVRRQIRFSSLARELDIPFLTMVALRNRLLIPSIAVSVLRAVRRDGRARQKMAMRSRHGARSPVNCVPVVVASGD